ncbi:hypothetical protein [Rhodococcus jostii]|uniref:Uncharacterized protein n=1 Tax=Rhodococcus jostii TaxID=132919 RepID=A0A1H5AZ31_RHOJO|nr:hypothetical protein [Rhodococcus jostii]SED47739.1 hypothetical protein SAMN04490220_4601 [Rhodococcus jostii]
MTDPAYIKDPENFHSDQWDHARIANAVASMDAEHGGGIARAWTELGTTAHDTIVEFSDAIKKTISESWHGAAASAAYGETERYSSSAPQAQEQLHGVAGALTPLVETVASLRSQVPETIGTGLWDKLTRWDTDTEDEYSRREGEAREKMATIYNPGLATSDGNVPSFTKPESIVDVPSGPPGPGVGDGGGAPSSGEQFGVPNAGQPSSGGGPDSEASAAPAVDGTPAVDDTEQDAATSPSSAAAPAATTPTSVTGDQTQGRSGLAHGADSPSGAGSRSAGAGSGGGAGVGGLGVGGLGGGAGLGSRPGSGASPGAKPGTAGLAAGGRTGAGVRGTGPMGGGMMGGGAGTGKGGGDDREHKTPDYLITLDNGNELIGRLPLVSPPVIGA